jgi:hypothetical protein
MVTCVVPGNTTKLTAAPVYPMVTVPVHLPGPHEHVPPLGQLVVQSVQTPPVPHAVVLVPATQVPLVAPEQHPPLHVWFEEQSVVHECVVVSHACPTGQSLAVLQHLVPLGQLASDVASPFASACGASDVLPSPGVMASSPSGDVVASSEPPSPARMGSPMPAIAAHPALVSASASAVGASRMPVIARLPSP